MTMTMMSSYTIVERTWLDDWVYFRQEELRCFSLRWWISIDRAKERLPELVM